MKQRRAKPECPKGFKDYFNNDVRERNSMLAQIAEIFELHGFDPLETSGVETLDALGKYLPDTDRPNEGVFAWKEDKQWLALRYDLTAPLSRVVAQFRNDLPSPYRRYAIGPVWRNEKPGQDRFRQFYQCDADTVGTSSMAADAEICILAGEVLQSLGMQNEDFRIRINNRKILEAVLENIGLFNPEDDAQFAEKRLIVLRALDKLDRLGAKGVIQLLGSGRRDNSGDFTKGAELSNNQTDTLMAFLSAGESDAAFTLRNLQGLVQNSELGRTGLEELNQIMEYVSQQSKIAERCSVDPSVVRGLGYYTGPVIEAELCFKIEDDKGRLHQFGSVAGGGRYDDLVKRFTGQQVPATGLSIGVDRLLAALKLRNRSATTEKNSMGPVLVTVMDPERMASYQEMAAELRQSGIRAEVFLGNAKNFSRQMKYADKRGAPAVIIEGSKESETGTVQIKNLVLGKKIAETATHEEWKELPSQFAVPRKKLVEQIRKLIKENLGQH